jgi:hypothetical protein
LQEAIKKDKAINAMAHASMRKYGFVMMTVLVYLLFTPKASIG